MSTTMLRSAISIAIRCVHRQLEKHAGGNLFVCLLFVCCFVCLLFCLLFCLFVVLLFCWFFLLIFWHLAFLDAGTKN